MDYAPSVSDATHAHDDQDHTPPQDQDQDVMTIPVVNVLPGTPPQHTLEADARELIESRQVFTSSPEPIQPRSPSAAPIVSLPIAEDDVSPPAPASTSPATTSSESQIIPAPARAASPATVRASSPTPAPPQPPAAAAAAAATAPAPSHAPAPTPTQTYPPLTQPASHHRSPSLPASPTRRTSNPPPPPPKPIFTRAIDAQTNTPANAQAGTSSPTRTHRHATSDAGPSRATTLNMAGPYPAPERARERERPRAGHHRPASERRSSTNGAPRATSGAFDPVLEEQMQEHVGAQGQRRRSVVSQGTEGNTVGTTDTEATKEKTVGERLKQTKQHAEDELKKYKLQARATVWSLNFAIGLQVVLGALTTGIAAATTGRQTSIAVSVLGGLSTLSASYLAKMRGSGEPEFSAAKCAELESFARDLKGYVDDHEHLSGKQYDGPIKEWRKRFEEILGNKPKGIGEVMQEGLKDVGGMMVHGWNEAGQAAGAQFHHQMDRVHEGWREGVQMVQGEVGEAQRRFHDGVQDVQRRMHGDVEEAVYGTLAEAQRSVQEGIETVQGDIYGSIGATTRSVYEDVEAVQGSIYGGLDATQRSVRGGLERTQSGLYSVAGDLQQSVLEPSQSGMYARPGDAERVQVSFQDGIDASHRRPRAYGDVGQAQRRPAANVPYDSMEGRISQHPSLSRHPPPPRSQGQVALPVHSPTGRTPLRSPNIQLSPRSPHTQLPLHTPRSPLHSPALLTPSRAQAPLHAPTGQVYVPSRDSDGYFPNAYSAHVSPTVPGYEATSPDGYRMGRG